MNTKNLFNQLFQNQISQIKHEKKAVYRYMHDETYLDMFCEGKIRMSTLEICRNYENQEQGDKDEGKETFIVSHMTDKDPNFHKKAEKLSMLFTDCSDIIITNCTSEVTLRKHPVNPMLIFNLGRVSTAAAAILQSGSFSASAIFLAHHLK